MKNKAHRRVLLLLAALLACCVTADAQLFKKLKKKKKKQPVEAVADVPQAVNTDSLQMGAVTQSTDSGQAAVAAIEAGCDLLLMPKDFPAARSAVLTAVQNGTISEKRLNASVTRILKCKVKLNKTAGLK